MTQPAQGATARVAPPPAITNIRLRINVCNGYVAKNVIYDRINNDGTYDTIERLWKMCYHEPKQTYYLNTMVKIATPKQVEGPAPQGLRAYIRHYENGSKGLFPADQTHAGSYTGKIISTQHIVPIPVQIQALNDKVTALQQTVDTLTEQNQFLVEMNQLQSAEIIQMRAEITQMGKDLTRILELLQK